MNAEHEFLQAAMRKPFNGDVRKSYCDEAKKLVLGDRNDAYGSPEADFAATGLIWTALLRDYMQPDKVIPARIVALMMVGLKLNRHAHRPKEDNLIDAHGYLFCSEWIETKTKPE